MPGWYRFATAYLLGFLLAALTLSRIPSGLAMLVVVIPHLPGLKAHRSIGYYAALALGCLSFLVVVCLTWYLLVPSDYRILLPEQGYSAYRLAGIYGWQLVRMLPALAVMGLILVTSVAANRKLGIPGAVIGMLVIFVSLLVRESWDAFRSDFSIALIAFLICAVPYLVFGSRLPRDIKAVLVAGAIMPIASFAGSDTGVYKAVFGMWFVLPATLQLLISADIDLDTTKFVGRLARHSARTMFATLVLASPLLLLQNPYRAGSNRAGLTRSFSHHSLYAIRSTDARVAALDELLYAIDTSVGKDKTAQVVGETPLIYFLGGLQPTLGVFWGNAVRPDNEQILSRLATITRTGSYPRLIIVARKNPASNWPESARIMRYEEDEEDIFGVVLQHLMASSRYKMVLRNAMFDLYLYQDRDDGGNRRGPRKSLGETLPRWPDESVSGSGSGGDSRRGDKVAAVVRSTVVPRRVVDLSGDS